MKIAYFSTKEASKIAGYRSHMMVDYLCRSGIVVPTGRGAPGRGRRRLYTLGDLVLLRAVNRLLSSGLTVARLKKGLGTLSKKFQYLRRETAIERYLITDGKSIVLNDNPSALVDLTEDGQLVFAFIVDINQAKKEVIEKAEEMRLLAS